MMLSSRDLSFAASGEDMPTALSSLIDGAVAAFDVDRSTSRRYLMRASALLRARQLAHAAGEDVAREVRPRGGLARWQVNRVIDYIETHLAEKITGQALAALAHLSIGQLFRGFKVSVGAPPFHYIALRRFELACTIMKASNAPLSQVAIACGLSDQSHLCRVFRRITGVSPAVWRRYERERVNESRCRAGLEPQDFPDLDPLPKSAAGIRLPPKFALGSRDPGPS